jgi:ferritin-like metal-binding protein YciE
MYTALKAFADGVNDHETTVLADDLLNEEHLAAERIARLIPQVARYAITKANIPSPNA